MRRRGYEEAGPRRDGAMRRQGYEEAGLWGGGTMGRRGYGQTPPPAHSPPGRGRSGAR